MEKATLIQFRRGRKTYKPRHFLLEVEGVDSREKANKYLGRELRWVSSGKESKVIKGKVSSAHGNNGVLRAIFEKGLPGQAIGSGLEVV